MKNVKFLPKVIKYDRYQPEFYEDTATYVSKRTSDKKVKSGILTDGKTEIERLTATAKSQIGTIELKIRNQISEYVVSLALERVTIQLEGKLGESVQQQLIDKNISKL